MQRPEKALQLAVQCPARYTLSVQLRQGLLAEAQVRVPSPLPPLRIAVRLAASLMLRFLSLAKGILSPQKGVCFSICAYHPCGKTHFRFKKVV